MPCITYTKDTPHRGTHWLFQTSGKGEIEVGVPTALGKLPFLLGLEKWVSSSPGWLWTCCVAEDGLKYPIFLPPLQYWNYRCAFYTWPLTSNHYVQNKTGRLRIQRAEISLISPNCILFYIIHFPVGNLTTPGSSKLARLTEIQFLHSGPWTPLVIK